MADTKVLEAFAVRRAGSSPVPSSDGADPAAELGVGPVAGAVRSPFFRRIEIIAREVGAQDLAAGLRQQRAENAARVFAPAAEFAMGSKRDPTAEFIGGERCLRRRRL